MSGPVPPVYTPSHSTINQVPNPEAFKGEFKRGETDDDPYLVRFDRGEPANPMVSRHHPLPDTLLTFSSELVKCQEVVLDNDGRVTYPQRVSPNTSSFDEFAF